MTGLQHAMRAAAPERRIKCGLSCAFVLFFGIAQFPSHGAWLEDVDRSSAHEVLAALDRDIAAAEQDKEKLTAIETRLLDFLHEPGVSSAVRQVICERLGTVLAIASPELDERRLAAFAVMLTNDHEFELARLALEPVPGQAVDRLFLDAMGKSTGQIRLGIIQSIGVRRIEAAVPFLGSLLDSSERKIIEVAAHSLAEIGSREALAVLRRALVTHTAASGETTNTSLSPASKPEVLPVLADAKLAIARRLPAADAETVYREIKADGRLSIQLQAAALRGLIDIQPAAALDYIIDALEGDDWTLKQVALQSMAALPGSELVSRIAPNVSRWDRATQVAAIAALGRTGSASAVPLILEATGHEDVEVRGAAITALALLPGSLETTNRLARIVAEDAGTEVRRLARQSLARLHGPGVSDAILAGADRSDPKLRVVYLEQLALRYMTEGIPLVLSCRSDPDPAVRAAAVGALGDIASMPEQAALLAWASDATDSIEQQRALRSLVSVTLRDPDMERRARPIFDAIENSAPDVCLRLLPVLQRLGGVAAAQCGARVALSDHPAVSPAAVATLGRWTDRTAVGSLATIAMRSRDASVGFDALQAALNYLEGNREPWGFEMTRAVAPLMSVAHDDEMRERILRLLARASDDDALALVAAHRENPVLEDMARDAEIAIRANREGPTVIGASAGLGNVPNIVDGKLDTAWTVPASDEDWIEVDLKLTRPIRRITLDQTGRTEEFPERYEVYVSDDAGQFGEVRASGIGRARRTIIELPPGVRGRYIKIKNTAQGKQRLWTICELFVD